MRQLIPLFGFALAVLTAAQASAQTPRDRRPYRGLFGSGVGETEQMLSVSFSAGGGYDDDVLLSQGVSTQPSLNPVSSTIGQAFGGVSYSLSRGHASFNASGSIGASYYPAIESTVVYRGANFGGTYQFSDRTNVGGTVTISYQPLHFMNPLPVLPDPLAPAPITPDSLVPESIFPEAFPSATSATDPAFAIQAADYLDITGGAGLGHALTRRISTSAYYGFRRSNTPGGDYFVQHFVGAGLQYRIGRGLAARAGYTLSDVEIADGEEGTRSQIHQIDAGIDFSHGISLTRRTTLAFRTGTSFIADEAQTHFMFTGNVLLTHEIGRTWMFMAGYNRDVSFLETFSHPVLADSLNAGVGGLLSRRLQFQANLVASRGTVGLSGVENGFTTYAASTGLRYGLWRYLGLSVDYSWYRYRYEAGVELPESIPPHSNRHSIRAGLNFWAPVFSRSRRSNASR